MKKTIFYALCVLVVSLSLISCAKEGNSSSVAKLTVEDFASEADNLLNRFYAGDDLATLANEVVAYNEKLSEKISNIQQEYYKTLASYQFELNKLEDQFNKADDWDKLEKLMIKEDKLRSEMSKAEETYDEKLDTLKYLEIDSYNIYREIKNIYANDKEKAWEAVSVLSDAFGYNYGSYYIYIPVIDGHEVYKTTTEMIGFMRVTERKLAYTENGRYSFKLSTGERETRTVNLVEKVSYLLDKYDVEIDYFKDKNGNVISDPTQAKLDMPWGETFTLEVIGEPKFEDE